MLVNFSNLSLFLFSLHFFNSWMRIRVRIPNADPDPGVLKKRIRIQEINECGSVTNTPYTMRYYFYGLTLSWRKRSKSVMKLWGQTQCCRSVRIYINMAPWVWICYFMRIRIQVIKIALNLIKLASNLIKLI